MTYCKYAFLDLYKSIRCLSIYLLDISSMNSYSEYSELSFTVKFPISMQPELDRLQ